MKTDAKQVTTEPLDVIQRVESTLAELEVCANASETAPEQSPTYVRIESSHRLHAPTFRDAAVAKIRPRRRPKRATEPVTEPAAKPAIDVETSEPKAAATASFQFTDHAQNIIDQLRQWSLQLDTKQHQLDTREQALNRRERLLRQMQ